MRVVCVALVVALTACGGERERAIGDALRCDGAPVSPATLFAADSPFNTPIPGDAAVDPQSDRYVEGIREAARESPFVLSVRRYTVAVYHADARTPRYDVALTADYEDRAHVIGVPIPDGAEPDPSEDGHLAVIDDSTGCEYDFWQARKHGDRWEASAGNALRLDGSGVHGGAHQGATAAGFALTAGLVFPRELRAGAVEHALFFAYPLTRAGDPVAPAVHSDGTSHDVRALPEGARLRLDPALDLTRLGLRPYELVLARAMQRYGLYLGDSSGTPSVFAANALAYPKDPYVGVLPGTTYVPLDRIPLRAMRVLRVK